MKLSYADSLLIDKNKRQKANCHCKSRDMLVFIKLFNYRKDLDAEDP